MKKIYQIILLIWIITVCEAEGSPIRHRFNINREWKFMLGDIVVDIVGTNMVVLVPKGTIAEVYGKLFTGPKTIKMEIKSESEK